MIPRRPEAGSLALTLLSVATEGSGAIFGGSFLSSFLGRFELVFGRFWAVLGLVPGAKKPAAPRCGGPFLAVD
jgi:hypothetical protein